MKIANIVCAWPPYAGGMGNSAKLISEIISENHDVENFYPENMDNLFRRGHGAFSPKLLFKLKKFDYIYLHYPFFGTNEIVYLFKLFNKKTKLIIHYHMDVLNSGYLEKVLSVSSKLTRNSLFKKADKVVCSSFDYLENSDISHLYKKYPDKFHEIPFGIDLETFKPKNTSSKPENNIIAKAQDIVKFINEKIIKKDKVDLIFVGGLDKAHYFKGIDILLEALSFLREKDWKLTIVGDGELKEDYKLQAYQLGLDKKVNFAGKLSNEQLINTYQNSDLLILPSINKNEAFGIVLIEAMACGVPVITSNLPGVRSVFEHEKQGLVFKTGNKEDLKEKIEYILNNKNIRKMMSSQARHLAEEKYSLEKMKTEINKLFV
ncbi:MAG: glycosyltransferase family 4 protein [Patescibacteria group bacterium]|jgi:glycosyltransferase involved in cell wall biosynthesis|nr:glycosyltransferase family 4 protein [Patescibacteria group bacterium]